MFLANQEDDFRVHIEVMMAYDIPDSLDTLPNDTGQ
jgi:hypothetical protein